jgi:putative ABC transport system permease protein
MSASAIWLFGLLRRRAGRMLPAILGVSLTIALLAVLGIFINSSAATMTRRALGDVPVDWQVQIVNGADPSAIEYQLRSVVDVRTIDPIGYASVSSFTASSTASTQTTSAGKVLGVTPKYWRDFPGELRRMLGRSDGVLIAQQTAANLHVSVCDSISVSRIGLPPVVAHIDGVIDLPQADALFQAIGVSAAAAPQAPPDNVLIVPIDQWHLWFDQQAIVGASAVSTQLHVRLDHKLPPDPRDAYIYVQQLANKFEARTAGSAVVGNNLGARLDGVGEDALYARVLFLFLGLPGAVLAIILTFAVSATGSDRRRREQSLLRVRGATTATILRLQSLEAVVVSGLAVIIAIAIIWVITQKMLGISYARENITVILVASAIGILTALAAAIVPAWRETRDSPVRAGQTRVGRAERQFWERTWIDVIMLALAGVVYWRTAASGYQIVLAPEGVAQTSVSYGSFIAPLALWIGVGLLVARVFKQGLVAGRSFVAGMLRPIAGSMAPIVAASISRQARLITRGVVLVTLAFSFAVSTAVFNTTYNVQSNVDAELTNGADVTVTGTTAFPAGRLLGNIAAIPGVRAARGMIHRFAYVGNDLQDIYGIDAHTIGDATNLSNAFFGNYDARATMAKLASQHDAALLSQETVNDYQLKLGDVINLRLQSAIDHQYHPVLFHFVGIAREFPTAPHDSFIVANDDYLARMTGDASREVVLIRGSVPPKQLSAAVRPIANGLAGARVTDLGSVQQTISSSLTAVDLRGLTWIELSFAVLLIAGASGLVLGLGLIERRRDFALLAALGAKRNQLGAFLWAEGLIVLVSGMILGTVTGFGIAKMLVDVLTGVFDPPPQSLAISWPYLLVLVIAGCLSTILAVLAALNITQRKIIEALRSI